MADNEMLLTCILLRSNARHSYPGGRVRGQVTQTAREILKRIPTQF